MKFYNVTISDRKKVFITLVAFALTFAVIIALIFTQFKTTNSDGKYNLVYFALIASMVFIPPIGYFIILRLFSKQIQASFTEEGIQLSDLGHLNYSNIEKVSRATNNGDNITLLFLHMKSGTKFSISKYATFGMKHKNDFNLFVDQFDKNWSDLKRT